MGNEGRVGKPVGDVEGRAELVSDGVANAQESVGEGHPSNRGGIVDPLARLRIVRSIGIRPSSTSSEFSPGINQGLKKVLPW